MRNYLTKGPRGIVCPKPSFPREKWMVRDYAHRGVRNSMRNYLTKGPRGIARPKPSFPKGEVGWCEIMLTEG